MVSKKTLPYSSAIPRAWLREGDGERASEDRAGMLWAHTAARLLLGFLSPSLEKMMMSEVERRSKRFLDLLL